MPHIVHRAPERDDEAQLVRETFREVRASPTPVSDRLAVGWRRWRRQLSDE